MDRTRYNLSHLTHRCGQIGRIQTLSIIPVEAGASLELSIDGVCRLAPTRKEIVSECQVDILAFHVPHRIIYGQDWIDFINAGPDEAETFTGVAIGADYRNPAYLLLPECGATINRALLEGYNRIFYNYFAVPSWPYNQDDPIGNNMDFDWYPTTEAGANNCRQYGRLAARLPHVLNGGNLVDASGQTGWEAQDLTSADSEVTVTGGTFSLQHLEEVKSRFRTESEKAWFAHFYQDIMNQKWDTNVTRDADPRNLRPEYLGRHTQMLSGFDVDGTDDATLGTFQGKTLDRLQYSMPRKHFQEHGFVWIMAVFRYPLVHTREVHPLLQTVNWTYDDIAADPTRVGARAPDQWDPGKWLYSGSTLVPSDENLEPYGQHYRFQNNVVHPNFETIPGYPFSNWNGTSASDWYYYQNEEYRDTFQTTQIGEWQLSAAINCTKFSPVPTPQSSIFAGA